MQNAVTGAPPPPIAASTEVRSLDSDTASAWQLVPQRSKVSLAATTAFATQTFFFRRFHAQVVGRESPHFHAEIETASLEGGAAGMASFARRRLLETDKYPTSTFDGVMHRNNDGQGRCTLDGIIELHGVTKSIHFDATVTEHGDEVHMFADFTLKRAEFNVHVEGALEAFLPDDVRVTLDVVAKREPRL